MKHLLMPLACALLLVSCVRFHKTEPSATKHVSMATFERIELYGSASISYRQGDSCTVTLEGPVNQVGRMTLDVKDDCLVVSSQNRALEMFHAGDVSDVTVCITSPDLTGLTLWGSGDFQGCGRVDTDNLTVNLKGSGDVRFEDIICDQLKAEVLGSGDMELTHVAAQQVSLSLVGSGDLEAQLNGVDATLVSLLGSGDIEVDFTACKHVECKLNGSGDIELKGQIEQLMQQKSGSGDIDTDKLTLKK